MDVAVGRTSDDALDAFLSVRARLFGVAYRILNDPSDAEDIVQEVWLRWQTADHSAIRNAGAFLVTTATHLAINVLQSARWRHETSVDSSLPEPADSRADARSSVERSQALEAGVSLLLRRLTPAERAAYILREAFDYSYREVADVLDIADANARQVVTRARQHVADTQRLPARSTEERGLLDAFLSTSRSGNVAALEGHLASSLHRHVTA